MILEYVGNKEGILILSLNIIKKKKKKKIFLKKKKKKKNKKLF